MAESKKPDVDDSIKSVRLDAPTGAKRCGVFARGVVYEVGKTYGGQTLTPELATHLVKAKRFTKNPAPAKAEQTETKGETKEAGKAGAKG